MRALWRILVVSLLVLSLGLHWALLQTVAWTGMVIAYSRDASLRTAIAKTFDGQHPCALCQVIQKGRAEEKKQDQKPTKTDLKLDPALLCQSTTFQIDWVEHPLPSPDLFAPSRADQPPKPRPRSLLPLHHAHA